MNIDAHWFRRRPENGGAWAVRLRWSTWEDGQPIQRQKVVETPHADLWKAMAHLSTRVDNLKMD